MAFSTIALVSASELLLGECGSWSVRVITGAVTAPMGYLV